MTVPAEGVGGVIVEVTHVASLPPTGRYTEIVVWVEDLVPKLNVGDYLYIDPAFATHDGRILKIERKKRCRRKIQ